MKDTSQDLNQTGFTLLEVVISFTIIALMAGMVFSSLRLALNSYEKSQTRLEEEAVKRVLFDEVKRQIGSLYPLRPFIPQIGQQSMEYDPQGGLAADLAYAQSPLFSGSPSSVTFVTVAPLFVIENPGLTVVRYGLAENEYGESFLGAMETAYTDLESFLMMADLPRGRPLPIVENVSTLEFEYYGYDPELQDYLWFQEWRGEVMQGVPRAIRINFDNDHLIVPVNTSFYPNALRRGIQSFVRQGVLE
jgi:hypothetical protein